MLHRFQIEKHESNVFVTFCCLHIDFGGQKQIFFAYYLVIYNRMLLRDLLKVVRIEYITKVCIVMLFYCRL